MRLRSIVAVVSLYALASCSDSPEARMRKFAESGDRYVQAAKYREAIIEYRNALKYAPNSGEIHLHLADAHVSVGEGLEASREYLRAAELMPGNVEAQTKAANFLLMTGRFSEAATRAGQVLEKDPDNVEALVLRGNALAGQREFDAALEDIEQALSLAPDSTSPYLVLGRLKLAQNQREDAESAYLKAVAVSPSSVIPRLTLGHYYWISGDYTKAERQFQEALKLEPDNLRTNRVLAAFYLSSGRRDEAEKHLRSVAKNARDVRSQLALADYLVIMGRISEAREILRPLANQLETHAQAGTRLASIADRLGELDKARQAVRSVLNFSPRYVPALLLEARFQLLDGEIDKALQSAKVAAEADPRSAAARYLEGAIYAARGDIEPGISAFDDVLKLAPRSAETLVQLSRLQLRAGRTPLALELARRSVTFQPNLLEAHVALARAELAAGQRAGAQREVEWLSAKFPKSSDVQALSGTMRLLTNDLPGARVAFSRSLQLDPASIEALAGLIAADVSAHQFGTATDRIQARLKAHPNDVAGLLLAARTYAIAGHRDYAEKLLRNALDLSPDSFEAYQGLAQLYASEKKLDAARTEFAQLATRQPTSVPVGTMFAVILHLEGRIDEAVHEYERVVSMDRTAAVAANNLAWLYVERNTNLDRAQELAELANKQLPKRPEVSDTLGWVYVKKRLWTPALGALQESVKADPKNAIYAYHLALALAGSGKTDQAKTSLQTALKLQPHFEGAKEASQLLESLSSAQAQAPVQ